MIVVCRVPGWVSLAVLCLCVMMLNGCDQTLGVSGRDAEIQRARIASQPFHVVSAGHQRAVVSARGRQVAIEAADGFCVAEESVEASGRSAFALIGDCVLDDPSVRKGIVPDGVPGIITVSISGDRGYSNSGNGAGSLSDLSKFLNTKEGRSMLGRGGPAGSVKIHDSRKIDDGLYVLVEDQNRAVVPILASRFWRSFIDLNDRLTVVTISGFRDKPMGNDEMLKHLVAQVKTLAAANRIPLNEPITLIAEASPVEPAAAAGTVQALSDLEPDGVTITTQRQAEGFQSPVPASRPATEIAQAPSEPNEAEPPQEFQAPEDVDPALRTEIASAAGAVPVPTRAPGRQQADQAKASDGPEAAVARAKPEDGALSQSAEPALADLAPDQTQTADAEQGPQPGASPAAQGAATESGQTSIAEAKPAEATAQATRGSDAPAATEDAKPSAAEKPSAKPDPADAPTASAPKTAPKAPKRPRQG